MRTTLFATTALLAVATSALPTEKTLSTTDVQERGITSHSTDLEKREGYWFEPSYNCLICMSACMSAKRIAAPGMAEYGYGPGVRMAERIVTEFSLCGVSCVNAQFCFAAQGFTFDYATLENGQRDSEPQQMYRSIRDNGMIDPTL